jgi:O-antigen/teichoic acid export membrane protein
LLIYPIYGNIAAIMLKNLLKDTITYGTVDFLWKFFHFALFPLLAFALTVADFGIYALLTVQSWLLVMLISCGLNNALERFYQEHGECIRFKGALIFSGLAALCGFSALVLGPGIAVLYVFREGILSKTQIPWELLALAVMNAFPMALFQFACNVFRLNFSPLKYAAYTCLQNVLGLSLSLYFIFALHWGVAGLLWGSFLSFCIGSLLAVGALIKDFIQPCQGVLVKKMLLFGVPFLFTDLARWIYGWMDRWLLEAFSNPTEVGLFSMAFKLATVLIFLMSAFGLAWTPHALKAHMEEPEHRLLFGRCLTYWYSLLTLAAIAMSLFGLECLMLLTPEAYWPAASLLPAVTAGLALLGTTQVTGIAIFITKKTGHFAAIAWIGALVNILFNITLVPRWGAQGSALATLITYAILALYHALLARQLYHIPLEYKKLGGCTVLLSLGCGLAVYLNQLPWTWNIAFTKGGFFLIALSLTLTTLVDGLLPLKRFDPCVE